MNITEIEQQADWASPFTLVDLFQWIKKDYGWNKEMPLVMQSGHDRLLVVTGENATGKSLLRRIISQLAKKRNVEPIAISPEFRQLGGIATAMVYGDESWEASGAISARICLNTIKTSKGRKSPHVIILDEPDMGLSDNSAAGCGLEIAEFIQDPPLNLCFFVIITHRRAFIQSLLHASHIRVGGDVLTLEQVYSQPIVPLRPQELEKKSHAMFGVMRKLLKS